MQIQDRQDNVVHPSPSHFMAIFPSDLIMNREVLSGVEVLRLPHQAFPKYLIQSS